MTHHTASTSPRRSLAMVASTLALLTVTLAVPAGAQLNRDSDITDPPETSSCPVDRSVDPPTTPVPEDGFVDVPGDNVHEFAIDCAAWYGVTAGTSATTYDPAGSVSREQMASFIAALLDYVADPAHAGAEGPGQALPPAPADNQFPCDVDPSSTHYDSIQRLGAAGVVEGTGPDAEGQACFDPASPVSRAQMASFIGEATVYTRNLRVALFDYNYFVDDDGNVHEAEINVLADQGITQGIGTNSEGRGLYGPTLDVKRDQMASFLVRTLDLLVEEAKTVPPSAG